MRKGFALEKQLNQLITHINKIGFYAQKNNVRRTAEGVFLEGEPFDYIILTKDYKACFDAKEVKGNKWSITQKDIKQANNLMRCKNAGMDSFFLIYFSNNGLLRIDVEKVKLILESGRKHVRPNECELWDYCKIF